MPQYSSAAMLDLDGGAVAAVRWHDQLPPPAAARSSPARTLLAAFRRHRTASYTVSPRAAGLPRSLTPPRPSSRNVHALGRSLSYTETQRPRSSSTCTSSSSRDRTPPYSSSSSSSRTACPSPSPSSSSSSSPTVCLPESTSPSSAACPSSSCLSTSTPLSCATASRRSPSEDLPDGGKWRSPPVAVTFLDPPHRSRRPKGTMTAPASPSRSPARSPARSRSPHWTAAGASPNNIEGLRAWAFCTLARRGAAAAARKAEGPPIGPGGVRRRNTTPGSTGT
ncbi:uncharacterized protein LOC143037662 [Oratosquilla oratoria]|uniref:uncharacterized protein LOC143037662 n=1 Tax=Oratosquilla oratoria TaxID=337810 RepID=UPI003F7636F7